MAEVRASVFAKLLAIMLTMTISLLVIVSMFFIHVMIPALNDSLEPLVDDYARIIAGTHPDKATAKQLAERLELDVRYEGPDGQWATSDSLPSIEQVRRQQQHWLGGSGFHIASAPAANGGAYLFRWRFFRKTRGAHYALFTTLFVLIGVTTVATYMIIRGLLRPLRTLGHGVAQLSAGNLDIVIPNRTRDEFGALTDAFNEMVGRVREMIRARDQLLLDVSHELRSPITRMRVATEMLPDTRDRARMIADLGEMEAMIAELLELERLRDGRGIRPVRQNLAPIVREVVSSFPRARIVSMPAGVLAEVDGEKIGTVLRNLIENAVKYSTGEVSVSVATGHRNVVIRVSDEGPGIPEEDLPTIFEPFFRVNRARTKSPAGYGLGLSICKRIVEAHGGRIEVENQRPHGAVFTVTLLSSSR